MIWPVLDKKFSNRAPVWAAYKGINVIFYICLQPVNRESDIIFIFVILLPFRIRGELTLRRVHDKIKELFALQENYIAN